MGGLKVGNEQDDSPLEGWLEVSPDVWEEVPDDEARDVPLDSMSKHSWTTSTIIKV